MAVTILENANDILINLTGEIAYLQDTQLWINDPSDATLVGSAVVFYNSDLGEASIEKLINAADVDYIGAFKLTFFLDNAETHTMTFGAKSTRGTSWQDFPLIKRKAFQKVKLIITAEEKATKIYSIELDFEILKRRRFN